MDMTIGSIDLIPLEVPPAVSSIRRIGDGFKAFQVLRAAYGSGLFDWLEQHGPTDKSTLAAALGLRGAHFGGFLQALEDLGLLVRRDNAYTVVPGMSEALCSTSPWCQAEAVDNLLAPSCGWSDLERFLSEGWTAVAQPAALPLPLTLHPFLGEANRLATYLTARQVERQNSPSVRTLLCFDGGDGLLAAALCQHFPDARVTVVVMPEALPRAEETIAACGLAGRCRVLPGTPLDPPPAAVLVPFDYVVLFHSLYAVRKSTADALAAVSACLVPGGELCCAHWFCLEACETAPGGLRDLDRAVLTDSHPLCRVEQFCQRLEEAGLIDTERDDLTGEYGSTKLHFARRPANR